MMNNNEHSKLSYDDVVSAATALKTSSDDMKTLLEEVKSLFNKIGDGGVWSGTAASNTKENFDQLSSKFNEFYMAIDDCSKYLNSVVENYKSVDQIIKGA